MSQFLAPNPLRSRKKPTKYLPLTILMIPLPPAGSDAPEYQLPSDSSSQPMHQVSPAVCQLVLDHAGPRISPTQSTHSNSPVTLDNPSPLLEPFSHQPHVFSKSASKYEKIDAVLCTVSEHFTSLSEFLDILFTNIPRGRPDP